MKGIVVTFVLEASMHQYLRELASLKILYQFALFNKTNTVIAFITWVKIRCMSRCTLQRPRRQAKLVNVLCV